MQVSIGAMNIKRSCAGVCSSPMHEGSAAEMGPKTPAYNKSFLGTGRPASGLCSVIMF